MTNEQYIDLRLQYLNIFAMQHCNILKQITLFFFFGLKVVHRFLYDTDSKQAVCEDATAASFPFPGIFLWENFISEEEEKRLINSMDQEVWNESQSGRRKQVTQWTSCFDCVFLF